MKRKLAFLAILLFAVGAYATQYIHETFYYDRLGVSNYRAVPASGAGVSSASQGELTRQTAYATFKKEAFLAAAVTADVTIATLPANVRVVGVQANLTQAFACAATCTSSTLSFVYGKTTGGNEYLASFDADAATAVFGDADAELGASITRAAAIQGGDFLAASTAIKARMTSGTGNIGTGTVTNLSQGSVTFYVTYEKLP